MKKLMPGLRSFNVVGLALALLAPASQMLAVNPVVENAQVNQVTTHHEQQPIAQPNRFDQILRTYPKTAKTITALAYIGGGYLAARCFGVKIPNDPVRALPYYVTILGVLGSLFQATFLE